MRLEKCQIHDVPHTFELNFSHFLHPLEYQRSYQFALAQTDDNLLRINDTNQLTELIFVCCKTKI